MGSLGFCGALGVYTGNDGSVQYARAVTGRTSAKAHPTAVIDFTVSPSFPWVRVSPILGDSL